MPALLPSETYAFELITQSEIVTDSVIFQLSLEWADHTGQRLLRVMTFRFPVSANPREVIQQFDEGALTAILVKRILHVMATEGSAAAANLFMKEAKPYQTLKALPVFVRGLLNHEFLTNTAGSADKKLATIMSLRSAGIVETLLYCCPRLISIDTGALKPLQERAFRRSMMVLHTVDSIYIWGPSELVLMQEVGDGITAQGFVDVELLSGPKADSIRGIVKHCWELSLRYLHVFPLFGMEVIKQLFLMDEGEVKFGDLIGRGQQIKPVSVSKLVVDTVHNMPENHVI
jgi:hypothetical protein